MSGPARRFSAQIVGPVWPDTDPDQLWSAAETHAQHAQASQNAADDLHRAHQTAAADNSGGFSDGYTGTIARHQVTAEDKANMHRSMSETLKQAGDTVHDAQTRLDDIDRNAHAWIDQAERAAQADRTKRPGLQAQIAAIATAAAGGAASFAASAGAAIASSTYSGVSAMSAPINGVPLTPAGLGSGGQAPQAPTSSGSQPKPESAEDVLGSRNPDTTNSSPSSDSDSDKKGDDDKRHDKDKKSDDQTSGTVLGSRNPAPAPTATTPPPSPAGSGASPMSGLSDLGKTTSGMTGLGSGMTPPTPPTPPGGLGTPPPMTPTPTPASAAPLTGDFSRGLTAGAASGGGAPVSAAPSTPATVLPPPPAAPGPQPVASTAAPASAGRAHADIPAAPPSPTAASAAPPPVMPPMGGGPLPPFTPDTARQVSMAAPPAPASPPAAPPPAPASPPLPPGVLATGIGTSAATAATGLRSAASDQHLTHATQLVWELMHASRFYGPIDWCVAVFKTPQPQTVIISNEGASYIPAGVFLPRSAWLPLADPRTDETVRARWFSHPNPAETMLAVDNPDIELHALAVSTDYGGSAACARDAGIRHYAECSLNRSPISPDSPPPPLDGTRMHRLEAIDPAAYARLTTSSAQLWPATRAAVTTVLTRASAIIVLSVPPVIRHVTTALDAGEPVTDEQWDELEEAARTAAIQSAAQRAAATPYGRAYHDLARAAELLSMWRTDSPYNPEIAYLTTQIERTDQWAQTSSSA